ncbi:hypothetical protein JS531_01395 [Bifidobacterium sp. CP2]|uniref:hypothetical protein n=1 Tax=Bifidobacterium sp. CP2 TaxID=2809025 RepID=UPI001BDD01A5|nr:hypothetical protein [Bifidobacterium sp. CP2]MBT1180651.1 hypothetical protein [Bifidobacterium sp. CP2]
MEEPPQRPFDAVSSDAVSSDARDPYGDGVVTEAERAAVAAIRAKALIWLVAFLIALVAAVVACLGGTHGGLWGVGDPAALARAYPWLACAAVVTGVVALTYTLGWRRGAAVIRDAAAGDRIAVAYLRHGPRLGTVEWWWANPPVRPSSERRKVVVMGVVLSFVAVAFVSMAVGMWVFDAPVGGPGPASASLFAAAPFVALAAWCFVYAARPVERAIRVLGLIRWASIGMGLIGIAVTGAMPHGRVFAGGLIVASYAASHTMVRALRSLAVMALPGPVTMPRYREDIERDVARRARRGGQVASEGWGLDMVRERRERAMFVRYTLISVGLIAIIAVAAWVRTMMG